MAPTIAVIAAGSMGSGIGQRLTEHGATVVTSLAGRSAASAARAAAAGMRDASDADLARTDFVLSIVPPGQALALAERLSPALRAADPKPVYLDCNAVSPATAEKIAAAIAETGCRFVDAGIIGGPPKPGGSGTSIYISGPEASRAAALAQYGLEMRTLAGPVGAASALKMSYAGITKGFTALGAVMMLAATRGGAAADLQVELAASQPALFAWLTRQMPNMYGKAYRWVAEMQEIAAFAGDDPAGRQMFDAAAQLYERLAADAAGGHAEIDALTAFCKPKG